MEHGLQTQTESYQEFRCGHNVCENNHPYFDKFSFDTPIVSFGEK
jgi:hypothetical protein